MNDDQWLIISTPELKALYNPVQCDDEFFHESYGEWRAADTRVAMFLPAYPYRRPRSKAWLKASEHPIQYPAWIRSIHWPIERHPEYHAAFSSITPRYGVVEGLIWQPAPAPAAPPTPPAEPWKYMVDKFLRDQWGHSAPRDIEALAKAAYEAGKANK